MSKRIQIARDSRETCEKSRTGWKYHLCESRLSGTSSLTRPLFSNEGDEGSSKRRTVITADTLINQVMYGKTLSDHCRFHEAVCLRRQEALISAMALREFQYGERLAVDHFRHRKDLAQLATAGADDLTGEDHPLCL